MSVSGFRYSEALEGVSCSGRPSVGLPSYSPKGSPLVVSGRLDGLYPFPRSVGCPSFQIPYTSFLVSFQRARTGSGADQRSEAG